MARGKPDFNAGSYGVSINQFDPNDIVSAIRSFGRIDGKGRVIFFEDFREGLANWYSSGVGSVHLPQITNNAGQAYISNYSVVFDTPTVGNTAKIERFIILPNIDRIGIEVAINIELAHNNMYLQYTRLVSPANRRGVSIYTDVANSCLKISAVEGQIVIPDLTIPFAGINAWLNYKLVFDFTLNTYIRLIVYNRVFDLSAYHIANVAGTDIDHITVLAQNNVINNIEKTYCGLCIITVDEP